MGTPYGDQLASAIARDTGITRPELLRAFATVKREQFLGPPPWRIAGPALDGSAGPAYETTAEVSSVYLNVSVALDQERSLYNGQPGTVAVWLDALNPQPGERAFHVGCGSGYYSAILATLVHSSGSVVALDIDEALVDLAQNALSELANVSVLLADAVDFDPPVFDVGLVNAGFSFIPESWLNGLSRNGGRLAVPLTVPLPNLGGAANLAKGAVFLIERHQQAFSMRMIGVAIIFTAEDRSSAPAQRSLIDSYRRGDPHEVKSLRREPHSIDSSCWQHSDRYCISKTTPAVP